jgi:hypothetical protein
MDIQEIVILLRERGCVITRSQVNAGGRFVHLLQPWDVAMFHEDIADTLSGRATLTDVVSRNRRADLADPWPVAYKR